MNNLESSVQDGQKQPYFITLEDFQAPAPTDPKHYDISDRISRDGFTSLLIDSFKISRGSPNAQYLFFEWLMQNNGFDYRISFGNFTTAGGWDCFSSQEQGMFLVAFRGIRRHFRSSLTGRERNYTDEDVIGTVHLFAKVFTNPGDEGHQKYELASTVPVDESLDGMSIQNLRQVIDGYIKGRNELFEAKR